MRTMLVADCVRESARLGLIVPVIHSLTPRHADAKPKDLLADFTWLHIYGFADNSEIRYWNGTSLPFRRRTTTHFDMGLGLGSSVCRDQLYFRRVFDKQVKGRDKHTSLFEDLIDVSLFA